MAVGIECRRFKRNVHAGKAGSRNALAPPRRACTIDEQIRVMNSARVAGDNLDGLNVAGLTHARWQDEIPKYIRAVGWYGEGFGSGDHEVRLAEFPGG